MKTMLVYTRHHIILKERVVRFWEVSGRNRMSEKQLFKFIRHQKAKNTSVNKWKDNAAIKFGPPPVEFGQP